MLVRNLGALPETVKTSQGGLTYNDESELLAGMRRLLEDRELRDRLGENGHATSREKWTADAYLERYLQLVQRLSAEGSHDNRAEVGSGS